MSYKHKCAYEGAYEANESGDGAGDMAISPCKNEVTENKIFCRSCFQSVTPAMRRNWGIAFPYDVPYSIAMKSDHADQREMIEKMREAITLAKLQGFLF